MFWADNFVLTPGHTGAGARGGGGGMLQEQFLSMFHYLSVLCNNPVVEKTVCTSQHSA